MLAEDMMLAPAKQSDFGMLKMLVYPKIGSITLWEFNIAIENGDL